MDLFVLEYVLEQKALTQVVLEHVLEQNFILERRSRTTF